MAIDSGLPEGYVLDKATTSAELPDGYVLDQPNSSGSFLNKINVAANAPVSGLMNAAANAALGGTQMVAGGLNKLGILPDTMNIGGTDYGYKAGNEGISGLSKMLSDENASAMQDNTTAKVLHGAGELAGNMALYAELGGANPGYAPAIGAGLATGALQPAKDQSDRLINAGISGLFSAGGKALGDIISPQVTDEAKQAALQTAEDFGIPVYRSQVSNSPITKAVASFEKDVPFSGATGKAESQIGAFNQAVNKTIGETGDAVLPEKLGSAYDRITKIYDDVTSKYALKVTPEFENELLKFNEAAKTLGQQGKEYALQSQVDRVMSKIKDGQIAGDTYQGIRSQISKLLKTQESSPELGGLLDLLDSTFQKGITNTRDLLKFQTARSQYRNLMSLERVVANSPNEAISPAKLQGSVKSVFGDYAYGGGSDLERLARLGNILKDSFPNSGTATRTQLYELAKHIAGPAIGVGIGGAEGYREGGTFGALAGAGAGLAANRFGITPYLYSQMSKNPSMMQQLLPAFGASAPMAFQQGAK